MLKSQSTTAIQPCFGQIKIDRVIQCETDLLDYIKYLRSKKISSIALDMEGDQGRIRYKYSISIFQCFDGFEKVIIDVLKIKNKEVLHQLLTCEDITKVMFSPANDIFMTQNTLGCTITPIRDISIGQKLLNLPINLSDYLNIDKAEKDLFQRANWLRRPIKPQLLDYAIKDVLELLKIDADLSNQLKTANLYTAYINGSDLLSKRNFVIDQLLLYKEKFPGYKRLKPDQKRLAAKVWIFREQLGKYFDCPVGYLLSKQIMAKIIHDPENIIELLVREVNRQSKGKNISRDLIRKIYLRQTASPKKMN